MTDFICIGMFDWQADQDADIVIKSAEEAKQRKRLHVFFPHPIPLNAASNCCR